MTLVERLESYVLRPNNWAVVPCDLLVEVADEIARLRALVSMMVTEVREIADDWEQRP